ncbi:MAG TPA: hypothetical protein VD994_18320, partial [Prosthecobacter sp.]|nr:hypothetical protein [Prosthecobacter sp.]
MKFTVATCLFCLAAFAGAAEEGALKLRWNNGESLSGSLLDATAATMRWSSPFFAAPLELQWHALRRIDQTLPAAEVAELAEPFTVSLRDGSQLHGDLGDISDTTVFIRSKRHGEAALKRSEVLCIRRLKGEALIWAGPVGDVGWSAAVDPRQPTSANLPPIPRLVAGPGGALVLPYWNTAATFAGALSDSVDMEFRIRCVQRPAFKLSLVSTPQHRLDIETWDDEIVFTAGNTFETICGLADGAREVSLRICWNKKERLASAFSAAGTLLAEWKTPSIPEDAPAKLVLQSKGPGLSLEFLRLRKWDGKPMPKVATDQPRIEMADGSIVAMKNLRSSAGKLQVIVEEQESEREVEVASVDAVVFSSAPPNQSETEATLTYADGTRLTGGIAAIQNGAALVKAVFAEEPVQSELSGLRQLLLNVKAPEHSKPEKPLTELDRILLNQTSLHGEFVAVNGKQPGWMPVGGTMPVLLTAADFQIHRFFPATANLPAAAALFYTKGWDILPGVLRSVDRSGAHLESDIAEIKHLSPAMLSGIQLNADSRVNIDGFNDSRWRLVKGEEKRM